MIPDIDIRDVAALLLKHHGDAAAPHASTRAAELLAAGDREGRGVRLRISSALE